MVGMTRAAVLVGVLATLAGGCQAFIGVEDVEAHLPRLDGSYLLVIKRERQEVDLDDLIRLRAMASLDVSTRTLDISYVMLGFSDDTAVAEGSISGIEFPTDSAVATFALQLQVPERAVQAPPPTGPDQAISVADMLLRAEAEYSFCARPADAARTMPTFGTVLLAAGQPLPTGASMDVDCDELAE